MGKEWKGRWWQLFIKLFQDEIPLEYVSNVYMKENNKLSGEKNMRGKQWTSKATSSDATQTTTKKSFLLAFKCVVHPSLCPMTSHALQIKPTDLKTCPGHSRKYYVAHIAVLCRKKKVEIFLSLRIESLYFVHFHPAIKSNHKTPIMFCMKIKTLYVLDGS